MFKRRSFLAVAAAALATLTAAAGTFADTLHAAPAAAPAAAAPASTEATPAAAAAPVTLALWAGTPPAETAPPQPEKIRNHGNGITILTNVWNPALVFHAAPAATNTGATVLICPGGAYSGLAWDHEGILVAEFFNSIGVNAAILKYRVPRRKPPAPLGEVPLKDAQRALSLLRANAADWKLDPARVGIMGFSAGGHLAAIAAAAPARTYDTTDDADKLSCRPDFAILVYPAYMTVHGWGNESTKEERARVKREDDVLTPRVAPAAGAPPAICFHSINDAVTSDGSLLYHRALRRLGVSSELHLYATGGHGWGMKKDTPVADSFRVSLAAWMKNHWAKPSAKPSGKSSAKPAAKR